MKFDLFSSQSFRKHPIKFLCAKILMRLNLSKFFLINRKNYFLRFYPSSYSRALWIEPDFRLDQELFFQKYLKEGDKVIDIGANIGTITIVSAISVGSSGRVYSIEAHPKIFQFLRGNIKQNKLTNVESFNFAVGSKSKTIFFTNFASDGQNRVIDSISETKVSQVKIDDIGIKEFEINLIKIDVEGYEKFTFLGANDILNKTNCVLFEAVKRNYHNFGYDFVEIYDILNKYDFKIYRLLENQTISLITRDYIPISEDLLAVKNIDDFICRTGYKIQN